jgi:HD-GYP domain-containing protein (c-di-GMP phosphodiesterase class II)
MPETILFIDKDEKLLNSVEDSLADKHFICRRASGIEEALDCLRSNSISVIAIDSRMADSGDDGLISQIRAISPGSLRVLMTTGTDIARAIDAINRDDFFRYIIKPLDISELMQTLEDAVRRFKLIKSLKNKDDSAMLSTIQNVELKDPYSRGHAENVARYALMIAEALDFPEEAKEDLRYGCWLHDLGKIDIPNKILNKKQPLVKEEYEIIKNHPVWGASITKQANISGPIHNIVLYHHERYDGSGYPSGISGNDIPLVARIVTVADVYSALTSDRAYRKRYEPEKAVDIMHLMRGNVFDPEILDIFLNKCLGLSRPCFETFK